MVHLKTRFGHPAGLQDAELFLWEFRKWWQLQRDQPSHHRAIQMLVGRAVDHARSWQLVAASQWLMLNPERKVKKELANQLHDVAVDLAQDMALKVD